MTREQWEDWAIQTAVNAGVPKVDALFMVREMADHVESTEVDPDWGMIGFSVDENEKPTLH